MVTFLSLAQIKADAESLNIPHKDKLVHFGMYFGMAFLLMLDTTLDLSHFLKQIIAIGFSIFYGGLMEVFQSFIPNRSADWWDVLANATGAVAGAILFSFICNHLLYFTNIVVRYYRTKKGRPL